jgi:hypothetical protein
MCNFFYVRTRTYFMMYYKLSKFYFYGFVVFIFLSILFLLILKSWICNFNKIKLHLYYTQINQSNKTI